MNRMQARECTEVAKGLWPRMDWTDERITLWEEDILQYDKPAAVAGIRQAARLYTQQPNFQKLVEEVRKAHNRANNAHGARGPTIFDEEKGCRVRWFAHGRVWTLFTDILSMERRDGTEAEWAEGEKEKRLAELEGLGVTYEELRKDHRMWKAAT